MGNRRVSKVDVIVLFILAGFFDLGFAILSLTGVGAIITFILSIFAYASIIALFRLRGVKIFSIENLKAQFKKGGKGGKGGRIKKKIWSLLLEMVPYLDILVPGYILFTYYSYKDACDEDDAKATPENQNAEEGEDNVINFPGRTSRRGSVPGSTGNRLEKRGGSEEEKKPNNVAGFRSKRPDTKYDYGKTVESKPKKVA